jgi:endoribonuclease Dicer
MTLANGRDRISLEKLEMIGDSVLKLIVTLHIYHQFPEFNEGQLTLLRTKLISNRHLFFIGEKKLLGEYLAGSLFEPENAWLPPGSRVPQRLEKIAVEHGVNYSVYSPLKESGAIPVHSLQDEEISVIIRDRMKNNKNELHEKGPMHTSYTHSRIGNKSVADCVEALIGAYYLSGGLAGALKFMAWMGLRGPTNENPSKEIHYRSINELPSIPVSNPRHEQNLIPSTFINQLEKLLDYK